MFVHLHQYDLNEPEEGARVHVRYDPRGATYIASIPIAIIDAANLHAARAGERAHDPQIVLRRQPLTHFKGVPC